VVGCGDCGICSDCKPVIGCGDCGICSDCKPDNPVILGSGRILAGDNRNVSIGDALEILKYLAKMDSLVNPANERSWNAALILPASKSAGKPVIGDALEILKKLAKMDSLVK